MDLKTLLATIFKEPPSRSSEVLDNNKTLKEEALQWFKDVYEIEFKNCNPYDSMVMVLMLVYNQEQDLKRLFDKLQMDQSNV